MILEALLYIVGFYLFAGLSVYAYGALKSWEFTGNWNFNIKDGYIAGICKYPRWLLGWLEWIVKKIGGSDRYV